MLVSHSAPTDWSGKSFQPTGVNLQSQFLQSASRRFRAFECDVSSFTWGLSSDLSSRFHIQTGNDGKSLLWTEQWWCIIRAALRSSNLFSKRRKSGHRFFCSKTTATMWKALIYKSIQSGRRRESSGFDWLNSDEGQRGCALPAAVQGLPVYTEEAVHSAKWT